MCCISSADPKAGSSAVVPLGTFSRRICIARVHANHAVHRRLRCPRLDPSTEASLLVESNSQLIGACRASSNIPHPGNRGERTNLPRHARGATCTIKTRAVDAYRCATHSISTSVFIGSSYTATQVRPWIHRYQLDRARKGG